MLALLLACTPPATDDTSPNDVESDADTDADADADTDADADADTDVDGCAFHRWNAADFATVIDVGPSEAATTPADVPWEALTPGTLVRIWPEGSPYAAKWVLDVAGREDAPVVVIGVCDPVSGALPIIDGDGAVTREELNYWNEDRSVLKIGGSSTNESGVPAWLWVEDLDIRGARAGNTFTDDAGNPGEYADNAAAIHVEEGERVTLRGNTLSDSGNGLFVGSDTSDLTVSSNHLFGNGNVGSAHEHNSYTEALGITFEYNRYGPLCAGCDGNNLKDRSAGTVIRYNWIEGGNRQLDLVESDHDAIIADARYREAFVYGNVLVEPEDDGNSQIVHFGGDGDETNYRRGTLYFYYNTVVSQRTGNTTLCRLSDADEVLDARGNVLFAAGTLGILSTSGVASLESNWLPEGWVAAIEGGLTVTDAGGNIEGTDPGFADDYALADGSAALDVGGAIPPAASAWPVDRQYVPHQGGEARPDDGAPDIGAFER